MPKYFSSFILSSILSILYHASIWMSTPTKWYMHIYFLSYKLLQNDFFNRKWPKFCTNYQKLILVVHTHAASKFNIIQSLLSNWTNIHNKTFTLIVVHVNKLSVQLFHISAYYTCIRSVFMFVYKYTYTLAFDDY